MRGAPAIWCCVVGDSTPGKLSSGGIVTEIAAPGEHVKHATAIAHVLAEYSPLALRITKQVLDVSLDAPREAALLLEQLAYSVLNDACALERNENW